MKYYAGIGSRSTPPEIISVMEREGARLAALGWTLRSGHAAGADRAFERGAVGRAVIYLPWKSFGVTPYGDDPGAPVQGRIVTGKDIALLNYEKLVHLGLRHPNCPESHKLLHGRNYSQICGDLVDDPLSSFVLYWCEKDSKGEPRGGTATAVKLARHFKIPTFNLLRPEVLARIQIAQGEK